MGEPGLSMGLVTTWRVGVDLDTITTLSQLISTFCSGSWAPQTAAINEAKQFKAAKKRINERVTCSSVLNDFDAVQRPDRMLISPLSGARFMLPEGVSARRCAGATCTPKSSSSRNTSVALPGCG